LRDLFRGAMPIRDVPLNTEMSRNAAALIIDAEIVALDAHRRAVHAALVGLRVDMTRVEHRAPTRFASLDVVREELRGCFPDELRQRHAILPGIRFIHNRHSLMPEYVLEQRVFIGCIVPLDWLIQHHDEKAVDGLREEQLAQAIWRKGHE